MLDWKGDMVQPNYQHIILLKDFDVDADIAAATFIGEAEPTAVGKILGSVDEESISQKYQCIS